MSEQTLKPKQCRALIQLAFLEGRVDSVGDLKPGLDSKLRRGLVDEKYLQLKKIGRATSIELTDGGWRWVMEHLASDLPEKEQVAKVLMTVLRSLNAFLGANGIDIQDVVYGRKIQVQESETPVAEADPAAISTNRALLVAAEELGGAHNPQIRLRELRAKLTDYSREQVDAAIRELQIEEVISVIPIDLPTDIDDSDREAAIEIAGKSRHAIIVRGR